MTSQQIDTKPKKDIKITTLPMSVQKKFTNIYLLFREDMFWYVRKKVGTTEIAEDLTADLFMKLLDNKNILIERNDSGVKAWLYTVARNMVIDYYRKNARNTENGVDLDNEVFEIVSKQDEDYLADEIKDEQTGWIIASLHVLTAQEKEIINLRFRDEMKFKEIADLFDKDEGAIKMQLYRALEKIKAHLGDRLER